MAWMKNLAPFLIALLGAILAPFAYFAGASMQAVVFNNVLLSLSIIALGWALLLPLLVLAANRFNGYALVKPTLTLQGGQHNA
jgi:hypothetical protein